jgi:FkbM family methyltransferase
MPNASDKTSLFVLTRFNVPLTNIPVNLGLGDGWLEHRFLLFESFCLLSVLAQEHKEFHWLMLVDPGTPEKWLARLHRDLAPLPLARIIPTHAVSEELFVAEIQKALDDSNAERVITTRLDNDDAISRDYLARVYNAAESCRRKDAYYVINFRSGLQASPLGLFSVAHKLNPFASLVSPRQRLVTVANRPHAELNKSGKVVDCGVWKDGAPGWIQTVHGNNIANRLSRQRAPADLKLLERFALREDWQEALRPRTFPVQAGEPQETRFQCHFALTPWQRRKYKGDIAFTGFKGEHLFEEVRAARRFVDYDLLRLLGYLAGSKPGVIIDSSGTFGHDAVFFAKMLGAKVICVEPNPFAVELLRSNLRLNALGTRIQVVEAALANEEGEIALVATSLLNLADVQWVKCGEKQSRAAISLRLDKLITQFEPGKVSLVKIKSLPYGCPALDGMLQTVQQHRPVLAIETGAGMALGHIRQTLQPFGYVHAGPFGPGAIYVFSPSRQALWRGLLLRRLARSLPKTLS